MPGKGIWEKWNDRLPFGGVFPSSRIEISNFHGCHFGSVSGAYTQSQCLGVRAKLQGPVSKISGNSAKFPCSWNLVCYLKKKKDYFVGLYEYQVSKQDMKINCREEYVED